MDKQLKAKSHNYSVTTEIFTNNYEVQQPMYYFYETLLNNVFL